MEAVEEVQAAEATTVAVDLVVVERQAEVALAAGEQLSQMFLLYPMPCMVTRLHFSTVAIKYF